MSRRLIIRNAIVEDAAALADVFRRSSLSNEADRENLLANPELLEYREILIPAGLTRLAVADQGHVAGFVSFSIRARTCEVRGLFVDPDFMGQGVAKALLADLLVIVRRHRVLLVEVTANLAAKGLYEKVGFVPVGEEATQFGPAPRMRLDLEPDG